jgi:hypothetical protein
MSDINAARAKEVAAFFEGAATTVSENPDAIEKGLYFMCVETAAMLRALGTERDALRAENEKLRVALQSSRRDALEEAAQIAAHHERMAYQRGDLPLGDPNECAAQVAREIEAAIRALGEKE